MYMSVIKILALLIDSSISFKSTKSEREDDSFGFHQTLKHKQNGLPSLPRVLDFTHSLHSLLQVNYIRGIIVNEGTGGISDTAIVQIHQFCLPR